MMLNTKTTDIVDRTKMCDKIKYLDLQTVLCRAKRQTGWNQSRLEDAESGYRAFLHLISEGKESNLVPTKDIDTLWHVHILDTKKYRDDCNRIFGKFIDHIPGSPSMSENERSFYRYAAINTTASVSRIVGKDIDPADYADCDINPPVPDGPLYCIPTGVVAR